MLNQYYEQELHHLRQVAAEFGKRNPALAPLLGSNASVDSDVERLLEGVAFLTGLVRQRLDDDFPELIQSIAQLLFPHFLRPLPCMTIMQYGLRAQADQVVHVPVDTSFAAVNQQDQRLMFSSRYPVWVEPLSVADASWETDVRTGERRSLVLSLRYQGGDQAWQGDKLRFWLGGGYSLGSRLYRLLLHHATHIWIEDSALNRVQLPLSSLSPMGFDSEHMLLPWPQGAHPTWRVLYEYFAFPEKFLFFELGQLDRWQKRSGNSFKIRFGFDSLPNWAPEIEKSNFVLHASPAVNVYALDAQPLHVDFRQPEYRVNVVGQNQNQRQIFSIDQVIGRLQDGTEKQYQPFGYFANTNPSYHIRLRSSAISYETEHFISLPRSGVEDRATKTLSIALSCTDGELPNAIRLGEISQPTDQTPTRIHFENIIGITPYCPPSTDNDLLWRVLSHLQANQNNLLSAEYLQSLLTLYLPNSKRDTHHYAAAVKQISSIQTVRVKPLRKMVRGMLIEGSQVTVECAGDHFSGPGSLYVFGAVLNEFLSGNITINTFVSLQVHDTVNGETLEWPMRKGKHQL